MLYRAVKYYGTTYVIPWKYEYITTDHDKTVTAWTVHPYVFSFSSKWASVFNTHDSLVLSKGIVVADPIDESWKQSLRAIAELPLGNGEDPPPNKNWLGVPKYFMEKFVVPKHFNAPISTGDFDKLFSHQDTHTFFNKKDDPHD